MKAFFLARHAESTWNRERRMQGHADPPLTDTGVQQSKDLAQSIQLGSIDAIVSSDLQRALQTAQAIAEPLAIAIDIRTHWREHDMGEWTGLTREEIQRRWPKEYARYRAGDQAMQPGGGESRTRFCERILAARAELDRDFAASRVLVVTHRGAIRLLLPEIKPAHAQMYQVPLP
jgi:broad specificity phosphatase PhoE